MKMLLNGLLCVALITAGTPAALAQVKPKVKPVLIDRTPAQTTPKETPPPGGTPRDFTLPEKEEFTLSNGLKAKLVPYGEVPKVTMLVAIQAGNVHEEANQVGIADLLGKLLSEGTTTLSATQLADKIARMGGSLNVSVGGDQTQIYASCLSEFAPDMVALLADVVQHPALPESELPRI
jgi:predicted Zn-dependent peptidase